MVKKTGILFGVLFFAVLWLAPSHAYELINGPTQLIQYDASKAYEGYTLFISGGKIYLIDMLGYVVHTWDPETVTPGMHFVLLENGHLLGNTGGGGGGGMPPGGGAGGAGGAGARGGAAPPGSGMPAGTGGAGGAGGQAGMPPGSGMPGGTGGAGGTGARGNALPSGASGAGGQGGTGARGNALPGGAGGAGGQGGTGGKMSFGGGAQGIVELDWDGNVVWKWEPGEEDGSIHHDFEKLPNGNILVNTWDAVSYEEVIAAGRDVDNLTQRGLAPDGVYEIDPDGNIVWKWSVWEHRGSNSKSHFDVNYFVSSGPDWTHFNAVDYNADADTILLCSRHLGEIYIIDHKTGDLLYRWGNPSAYGAGEESTSAAGNQQLFGPHDAQWIDDDCPGAGNILIYNNGWYRTPTSYSSVVEVNPETDEIVWEYSKGFASGHISGCQRLQNGNTLVCSGEHGHLFEVTPEGELVWEYVIGTNWSASGNVFRAHRYGNDYPGLAGKDLKPLGQMIEDIKEQWEPKVDLSGATQTGAKLWKKLWK